MVRIGITGGHHTGALVVAKKLKSQGHEIIWFGHRHTMANDRSLSQEYIEVTSAGIKFISLRLPKLFHTNPVVYFLRLLRSWPKFYRTWQEEKVDILLGFGSYLMVLPAIAAFINRVPFFIHEQTRIAGRSNYWLSFLAKKIFVSWPIKYPYPSVKTVYTGLPLRPAFVDLILARKEFPPLIKNSSRPTILVTAGKQGSHSINNLIKANLNFILSNFNLIHQTGQTSLTGDYDYFSKLAESLAKSQKYPGKYLVFPYLKDEMIMSAYHQANLIISRSGAHTSYELALLKKPALIIPAKFVPGNEQVKNAEFLAEIGVAKILEPEPTGVEDLKRQLVAFLAGGWNQKIKDYPLYLDSDQRLINQIKSYLS